jgi:predicted regulator of Ras-like GTPase activity (Roadblock/LC7/MglB family)
MEISESSESANADDTPAVPLEISQDVAEQADEMLRDLAEDAGLDTALIVDKSGALVTGISAEENVTVEVISALVAGASGAMRTLVRELGETGEIESLHQGDERTVYLREILGRFLLVGVSEAGLPVGVIREKSNQMREPLSKLLESIQTSSISAEEDQESGLGTRSLKEVAMERSAERAAKEPEEDDPLAGNDGSLATKTDDSFFDMEKLAGFENVEDEQENQARDSEAISILEIDEEKSKSVEENAEETPEPTEVIEPLDFGEEEIVIEADDEPAQVPFEPEEDETEEEAEVPELIAIEQREPVDSIFELDTEDDEETPTFESKGGDGLSNLFKIDSEDEEIEKAVLERADTESQVGIELDTEDGEEITKRESATDEAEVEEEEKDGEGSSPFYF